MGEREIVVENALDWLRRQSTISNVITGICDADECGMEIEEYKAFFKEVSELIFTKLDSKGYAIFIQTDRKINRSWVDKSYLLTAIAYKAGLKLVWHKIVLKREVDRVFTHRPGYSHMLCYTKLGNPGEATPDVIPVSESLYKNGTPLEATIRAVEFVKRYSKAKDANMIIDPFVGRGTIPAVANSYGLDAIGIDIDPEQAKIAESMQYKK